MVFSNSMKLPIKIAKDYTVKKEVRKYMMV
jgi:hypothetical protein